MTFGSRLLPGLSPRGVFLLLAVLTLSILLPLVVGGWGIVEHLLTISLASASLLLLLLCLKWQLNALRCHLLFNAIGIPFHFRETVALTLAYDFAAESTPGGIGGPLAGYTLLRRRGTSPMRIATAGSVVLAMDMAALLCLVAWAFMQVTLATDAALHWQILHALTLMGVTMSSTWLAIRFRRGILRRLGASRVIRGLSPQRRRTLARAWLRAGRILDRISLLPPQRLALIAVTSVAHWACRLSVIYLAILAIDHHAAWTDTLLIQFAGGFAGMVTGLPGGYGGADMVIAALLSPQLDKAAIATVLLIWRLMTFHLTLMVGGAAFLWLAARATATPREGMDAP